MLAQLRARPSPVAGWGGRGRLPKRRMVTAPARALEQPDRMQASAKESLAMEQSRTRRRGGGEGATTPLPPPAPTTARARPRKTP